VAFLHGKVTQWGERSMHRSIRRIALALVATLALAGLTPVAVVAQGRTDTASLAAVTPAATRAVNTFNDLPVRGTLPLDRVFRGTLDIRNFRAQNGQLYAIGRLTGRVLNVDGVVLRRITDQRVRLPLELRQPLQAAQGAASCDILILVLGPLHLDLLGLVIDLNRINLRITAEPGPGNLLGNLLCAITGLLDTQGLSGVLAQLLRAVRFVVNNL